MGALELFTRGDGVNRMAALLLLVMSVSSWVSIFWKAWLLRGGTQAVLRAIAAFWQAPSLEQALPAVAHFDRARFVLPQAAAAHTASSAQAVAGLDAGSEPGLLLTRALRDALHGAVRRLQSGQILLATVGATAPFVGLLGTVWGIHEALLTIAAQTGGFTIDKVAGPVGEALIMTVFGLAVAIPAVLAYNVFSRMVSRIEAELEGFAHDLLSRFAPGAS